MQVLEWGALERVQEHFADIAISICNAGDEVSPQLFVVRANSQGRVVKMVSLAPQTVEVFFGNDAGKDAFGPFVKELLTEGSVIRTKFVKELGFEPNVFVQVNEAWAAAPSELEEYADGRINGLTPSQHPNREEILMVTLHLPAMSIPVLHRIVDKPKRHAVKGVFPSQAEARNFAGRLTMQDAFGAETGSADDTSA